MNWTGGTLSRHAYPKANTQKATQRQKFARNNLLRKGFVKKSPAIIPFSTTWIGRDPDRSENNLEEAEGEKHGCGFRDQCATHTSTVHRVPAESTSFRKRPRSQSSVIKADPDRSEAAADHAATYVSHKRQEMLKKGDWLDLGLQANVGVKFNTTRENQNVGKRRHVHRDQRRTLHERLVQGAPHIFECKDRDVHGNLLRRRHKTRIRIGDHTLTPSIRSSVLNISPAAKRLFSNASQGSHDVMLLDQNAEAGIPQSSLHGHDLSPAICSSSYDAMLLDEFEEFDVDDNGLTTTMQYHLHPEHKQRQTSRWQYENAQDIRRLEQGNALLYSQLRRNPYYASNQYSSEPPSSPPIVSYAQPGWLPGHLDTQEPQVFTSSSDILQPTPYTFRVAQVLKSSSLYGDAGLEMNHIRASSFDDGCTTVAQIGQPAPVAPLSEKMNDKLWSSWLNIYNASERSEDEKEDHYADVDITPGISELGREATSAHDSNLEVRENEKVDTCSSSHCLTLERHASRNSVVEGEAGPVFKRPNKIWDRFEQMMSDLEEKFGPLNQEPGVVNLEALNMSDWDRTEIEGKIDQEKKATIEGRVIPPHPTSNPQNQDPAYHGSTRQFTACEPNSDTRELLAGCSREVFQEMPKSISRSRLRPRLLASPEPWVKFTFDNNLSSSSSSSRSPEPIPQNISQHLPPSSSLCAHASTSAAETTLQILEMSGMDSLSASQENLDKMNGSTPSQLGPQSLQATYGSGSTAVSIRSMSSIQPVAPWRSNLAHNNSGPLKSVDFMTSSPDPLAIGHG